MNKMKKIYVWIILCALFMQSMFSSIVFAQNQTEECNTCTVPSIEFQSYINFQVEMLQLLQKAKREKQEVESIKKVGLFGSKILIIPQSIVSAWSKMFKSEAEELVTEYKAVKMWAIMFGSMSIDVWSKIWWMAILFKNEPFVREWSTLQDLEMSIHDAMWDLWIEGLWEDTISNEIQTDILNLKQKYLKNEWNQNWLFDRFELKWSVKYQDITNIMLRLNSSIKTFVSINNEAVNTDVYTRGNITLQFNKDLMDKMINNYVCAGLVSACSSMFKDFANNTKVWSQIKNWFEDSKILILDANKRFSEAYLSFKSSVKDSFDGEEDTELWLTSRQLETLRSVYGIDTTKLSKEQWIGLERLLNGWINKNMLNNLDLWPLDYFSKESIEARKKTREDKAQQKQDEKYMETLSANETERIEWLLDQNNQIRSDDALRLSLQDTLESILIQKQEDKNIFLIYSNLWLTRYFKEIWDTIHQIVEWQIWSKDSKWLVKYLWDICEKQCSNKWTSNCYAN